MTNLLIPVDISSNPALKTGEKMLIGALLFFAKGRPSVTVTNVQLSRMLGVHVRVVIRWMMDLQSAGYIRCVHENGRTIHLENQITKYVAAKVHT